ncbi:MAG TPA: pantetheine-phosphate adenylyltransferase [Planctomycetaceae bacterium]|nr:pantetheine-phosphate adenylyltransferase [Planctomycetaceae bacterium]
MTRPLDPRHAVYAGSFDPLTLGHLDIIERGARHFDRLTVGVGINPDKEPLFSPEERLQLAREVLAPLENVDVQCFQGLAVDFVRACGAAVMLRGVRTLTDMEAEFSMSLANRTLAPDIETVFLMASEDYSHVSSTLIKQIATMSRDSAEQKLRGFLPGPVIRPLLAKCRNR